MKMPESLPPLFNVEAGFDITENKEEVVYMKYIQTKMGNAEANILFANGNFYSILLRANQSLKEETIQWEKMGVIPTESIQQIKNICNTHLVKYLSKGPHDTVDSAVENVNWYFYFDEPLFAQTQVRQWKRSPKFTRKINKLIERNLRVE